MMDEKPVDLLILSPHLDDATLSCGGTIAHITAAGRRVLIVTLMAGDPPAGSTSPYARSMEERWDLLQQAVAQRRQEDKAASRLLGADWLHWDVADCIYRRSSEGDRTFYNSDEEIFGSIHPDEQSLVEELAQKMKGLPPARELYVPLGIGHHVDHQLTRAAAERLDRPLLYYEDYPYTQKPGALADMIDPEDPLWQSRTVALLPAEISLKIEAIGCFASQISILFTDRQTMAASVRSYSTQVGGERFWYRA